MLPDCKHLVNKSIKKKKNDSIYRLISIAPCFEYFFSIKTTTFGMSINAIQDVSFEGCSKMEGGEKGFPPLNYRAYSPKMKPDTVLSYIKNTKNI